MTTPLTLVSHHLCPYVQRAVIVADEKGVPFERVHVDLARKPDWFARLSPTGKVPLLLVGDAVLFESAAICEYLDETGGGSPLHPADPLERARHRAWAEFASATLNDIGGLYSAPDAGAFAAKLAAVAARFARLEEVVAGPYFAGAEFRVVDAAFGPAFRYFDVMGPFLDPDPFAAAPKVSAWRAALAARPSVARAAAPDYPRRLAAFLEARGSHLSRLMARA